MKTNARGIALAWLVAFLLAAAGATVVASLGQRQLEARLGSSDAVFLGTSLTRFALPRHGEAKPLPQIDAANVLRIGLSDGTESDLLDLASAAVDAGVGVVFVEINPIVSRFAENPGGCGWWNSLAHHFKALKRSSNAVFSGRDIIGRMGTDAARNDRPRSVDMARLARSYPLHFDVPCHVEAWQELGAGSGASRIVMIAMPRDEIVTKLAGARNIATFKRAAREFSSQLGLPLFVPDASGAWSSDLFVDQAHMSQRGSDRFLQELAAWWLKYK